MFKEIIYFHKSNYKMLQVWIDTIDENPKTLEEYNEMIDYASRNNEFASVVFLYDHMLAHGIKPDDETFKFINRNHSKTVPEKSTIRIPSDGKKHLQPRRRIHKIMKGYNYTEKYDKAKSYLPIVQKMFESHPEHKLVDNKIKMAKVVSRFCKIDMPLAKVVVTVMKRNKLVKFTGKPQNQMTITHFFEKK